MAKLNKRDAEFKLDPKKTYTTKELKEMPQPVPKVDWLWTETIKDRQWVTTAIPDGELCTPRVTRTMTNRENYACYRNGRFIGFEPTVDLAKRRCIIGKGNELNHQVAMWSKDNPDLLPPFLDFTPQERASWRAHYKDAPKPGVTVAKVLRNEDPETAKLRAELAAKSSLKNGRKKASRGSGPWAEDLDKPIAVLKAKNPKKEGTDAHARWALLLGREWASVRDYLDTPGSNPTTLKNAVASKHVKVG